MHAAVKSAAKNEKIYVRYTISDASVNPLKGITGPECLNVRS